MEFVLFCEALADVPLVSIARRQELLLDVFIVRKTKVLASSQTPLLYLSRNCRKA